MRHSSLARSFLALALAALWMAPKAHAEFPGAPGSDPRANPPNDPDYPKMWQLYSDLPIGMRGNVSDYERSIGSGMHVDQAWQLHTGTPDTMIAVIDSGINWDSPDLIDKVYLNPGELPAPHGTHVHDFSTDHRLRVSDYVGDPRVYDANGNGVIDAGDLIMIFSDGVDNEHNGVVDDIAGWDFHEGTNNPADRVRFGHGTGEANDSVSGLNNGIGESGICGGCSFMMLRANDSFVVDANAFARAVIYGVDHGAAVIQEALGSANASEFTQQALNYAYEKNVVVIGSAADEDSYHHNFPGTFDPVVYTDAIRYDTDDPLDASTFLNFNNCSNYGARIDVATPGRSCSSEATANLAGVTGLASSYAKSLNRPLTAGEMIALIKTSATDINLGPNTNDPSRWPTYAGWDQITGYGRVNAFAMLDRIQRGAIPPEARITEPKWFALYANQPDSTGIDVKIQVRTPRSGALQIKLEVAHGVETSGATFALVEKTPILNQGITGHFATVPISLLKTLPANELDAAHDVNAFTLRLTVDDLNGHVSEARRTVFVFHDDRLLPGFPRRLAGSGESAGLFMDMSGDGRQEYITGDGGGYIHAFTATGEELSGFPAATAQSRYADPARGQLVQASIYAPVAAGDLRGDGQKEIVAVSMEGHVSAVDAKGHMLAGFPVQLPFPDMKEASPSQIIAPGALAAPVLVDLAACHPNDPRMHRPGQLDIVVAGLDGQVHAYQSNGASVPGFPAPITVDGRRAKLVSSPAVAQISGDGCPDLVLGSNHAGPDAGYLFAVSGRGTDAAEFIRTGFPTRVPMLRDVVLPTVGTGIPTAPVIGDFFGDGQREILVHAFVGKAYLVGFDGQIKSSLDFEVGRDQNSNDQFMLPAFGHPAAGDLLGDGKLEPVAVGAGRHMLEAMAVGGRKIDFNHMVGAWNPATGHMLDGFPKVNDDMALNVAPVIADLDGKGRGFVVAGSGGYDVHAWGANGEAPGFPHFTGGWVFSSVSAGDMMGDGSMTVAATTREGYVFAWRTDGRSGKWQDAHGWLTFKGNPQRTGTR